MSRFFRRLIFSTALAASCVTVHADDHEIRWYDVEVVVFENIKVPRASNTHWPLQAYIPDLSGAVELRDITNLPVDSTGLVENNELAAGSTAPRLLPADTHRLADEAAAVARSSRYRLLAHRAWRQAGEAREQAVPVHLQEGDPIPVFKIVASPVSAIISDTAEMSAATAVNSDELLAITVEDPTANAQAGIATFEHFSPVSAQLPQNNFAAAEQTLVYPFDGTITVALGRYLHVYTNLAVTKPTALTTGEQLQSYIMQSHRRMRSRKLHYIDHPIIGMLVLITPYEPGEN